MSEPMDLSALRMYQQMYNIDPGFDRAPMRALMRDVFRQLAFSVEVDLREEAQRARRDRRELAGDESADQLEAIRRSWAADNTYIAWMEDGADEVRDLWTEEVFESFLAHIDEAVREGGLGYGPWDGIEQVAFDWAHDNPGGKVS